MEENNSTELEEGEACCYREEEDANNNTDPDIAFSYIDEKIKNLLGHFQKEFEGGVSAENLGARFGGYGSFLPTYERSPHFSRQRSPERSSVTLKSPNAVPAEGTLQNVQAPATVPPSAKLQNANRCMEAFHSAKLHSGDVKHIKQESSLCTNSVVGCPVENGANKAENKTNQKSLKFLIKVGSSINTRKNVVLYDGLGLVGSPSTSLGSSSKERGASNLSFADILQVMTSFPVPDSELISPLHESLLSLVKKENHSVNNSETAKMSKQKKMKSMSQTKRLTEVQYGSVTNFDKKMPSPLVMNKLKIGLLEGEGSQSSNLGKNPLFVTCSGVEPWKTVASTSGVSMEACTEKVRSRAVSNVVRESNPGQDGGTRMQNGRKSLTVRDGELAPLSSDSDPLFDFKDNGKVKAEKSSVISKASKYLTKCEDDFSIAEEDLPRRKVGQYHGQNDADFAFREEKHITGDKKLKGIIFDGKEAVRSTKERLTGTTGLVAKDNKRSSLDVSPSINKVGIKSEKHSTRHMDHGDALASSNRELKCPEASSRGRRKCLSSNNGDAENDFVMDCSKSRNILLSGAAAEDVPNAIQKAIMPESKPAVTALETEHWVGCDSCAKWRLLPLGKTTDDLPEKWHCGMLDWLPEKIDCDTSQDETTAAVQAYLFSASQFQSHANGSISGITSSDIQHRAQKSRTFSNKLNSKEVLDSSRSNFLSFDQNNRKTSLQESVKSRSLSNMNQPPTESNSSKKTESGDPAKASGKLKHMLKLKEKNFPKGDIKLLKVKVKGESYGYAAETSKRLKTDESTHGSKHEISDCGLGRIDLSAQPKSSISSKYKGAEVHFLKEQKSGGRDRLLVSLKNPGNRAQAQASSDYASLDLNNSNKGSSSSKKRKLNNSQDIQSHEEAFRYSSKEIVADGIDECLSGKEKKFRALEITRKEMINKDVNDRTNIEVPTPRDFSSGIVNAQKDVLDRMSMENDRDRKRQKVLGPQQSLDHIELMRHGQILLTATSSSTKVSSSHKTRANYEVKGSPVESVSSSPVRVKLTGESRPLRLSDTKNGIAPVMDNSRKSFTKKIKINGASKLSRVANEEKLSSDFRQESLKCNMVDHSQRNAEPLGQLVNDHSFIGTAGFSGNGELHADTIVDHSAGENRACMKNRASASHPIRSGDVSKLRSKDRDKCPKPDFDRLGEKALETAMEERFESKLKTDHASLCTYKQIGANTFPTDKNDKNFGSRRESVGHSSNDGRVDKLAKEYSCAQSEGKSVTRYGSYGTDSSLNNLSHDSKGQTRAAPVSGDSRTEKSILALNPQDGDKQGTSNRASVLAVSQVSACKLNLVDASANGNVSKEVKMNKNEASNSSECFVLDRHEYKDVIASSPARVSLSNQTANDVLKKAKDLRDHADRLKNSGFTSESNGASFQAALKFLFGASLLETCSGESGKHGDMTPIQVYSSTAKLFQLCATEFEGHQEMAAAAALAYKCVEVAFMRVVHCKSASLSRDRHELQAALLQGESPSSSASDVDNLNNQATADKLTLAKGSGSQAVGSNIVIGRNRPGFMRLLDFTREVNSAMEASKKCHICYREAIGAIEKSKASEHMTSLKRVIDFSFQDIEGLLRRVQLAWEAIGRSGSSGAKD